MSKTQNPITGASTGKFGTAVFSRSLGKNIIRTVPVTGNAIPSDSQLAQRLKTTLLGSLAEKIPNFLFLGLGAQSYPLSAQNKFMKLNKEHFSGPYPVTIVDFDSLVFSTGQRATLKDFVGEIIIADNKFSATWDKTVDFGTGAGTDKVHVIIYDPTGKNAAEYLNAATRDDEAIEFVFPESLNAANAKFAVILTAAELTVPAPGKRRIVRFKGGNELATKVK